MSWTEANAHICASCESAPTIETIIEARKRDLGGFENRAGCISTDRLRFHLSPPCC